MLTIIQGSHLDHALTLDHLQFILARLGERNEFFIETLELPPELSPLPCALRGPVVGEAPVPEAEVHYAPRGGRGWPSRLVAWEPSESRSVTVIAGPHGDLPCVLFTAYGGPLAPREPGDPDLPEVERAASEAFWGEHALCARK